MHLLSRAQVPAWFDTNPFILSGYRPPSGSWSRALASWTYRHNETGNIYSHLVPGVMLAYGAVTIGLDPHGLDNGVVALQLATAVLCLFISTLYHTGLHHSARVAHLCLQLDYAGILVLILGNYLSGLHFGFYCAPALRSLYWSLVSCVHADDLPSDRNALPGCPRRGLTRF